MLKKREPATHRAARSREPEKERQEKEQVYIWPLFPALFSSQETHPVAGWLTVVANMFVAHEREDFSERPLGSRQKNTQL